MITGLAFLLDVSVVRLKERLASINRTREVIPKIFVGGRHLRAALCEHQIEVTCETLREVDDRDISVVRHACLEDRAHVLVPGIAENEIRSADVLNISLEGVLLDIKWSTGWADEDLTRGSYIETEISKKILKSLNFLESLGSEPAGCEIDFHFVLQVDR